MSKIKPAKAKKICEVKDSQKISSFFKILDVKRDSEDIGDFQVRKIGSKEKHSQEKTAIINETSTSNNEKIKSKKKIDKKQIGKNSTNRISNKVKDANKVSTILNDSDEDFVSNHLGKFKIKHKNLYTNSNDEKQTSTKEKLGNIEKKSNKKNSDDDKVIKKKLINPTKQDVGSNEKDDEITKNINKSNTKNVIETPKIPKKDGITENLNLPNKNMKNGNKSKYFNKCMTKNKNEGSKSAEQEIFEDVLKLPSEDCSKKVEHINKNKSNYLSIPSEKQIDLNDESNLIINLDTIDATKNTEKSIVAIVVTPEKTYLQCDEVLNDITNVKDLGSLLESVSLVKSKREKSPPHSTPIANLKKRKSPDPDVIPPTPEDELKLKSKICLDKKFRFQKIDSKLEEELLVPDMIVKSPPKKIRKIIYEPKLVVNLAELTEKEFEKLHATNFKDPVKEVLSIHENSLFDNIHEVTTKKSENTFNNTTVKKPEVRNDKNTDSNITIESPSLLQCPVLNKNKTNNISHAENSFVSPNKITTPKKNTSPSKWSAILRSPSKSQIKSKTSPRKHNDSSCIRSPAKSQNTLLDYFQNLPSSAEEKKQIEIDTSNYIRTTKSPKKFIEDVIEDFNFDDSWDGSINNLTIHDLNLENWQYCKVTEVSNDLYRNIILKVESLKNQQKSSVILQGIWQNIQLKKDDKINIIARKTNENIPYSVNNDAGFVVYEPDFLISGTSIVGSLFCKRKGVLSDKFRGFEPENQVMIVGTLVHRLLQETLKRNLSKITDIEKLLIEILNGKDVVYSSYASEVPVEVLKQQTMPFVSRVYDFVTNYVFSLNKRKDDNNWSGSIETIQDIEENIWCYNFGIKGKVDVTVKTKKTKSKQFNAFSTAKDESITLPLELKTGRASFSLEHRGQVILYTMIMTELGYDVNSGLLLYLREGVLHEVEAKHQEKRDLIMLRNELAYFLKQQPKVPKDKDDKCTSSKLSSKMSVMSEEHPLRQLNFGELPEPISHHNACKKCAYATICTALLGREENIDISETHPLKALSKEILSHLSQAHIDYFIHWSSLIHIESSYKSPIKELKDIWRLPPVEREILGKSLSYLEISSPVIETIEPFMHHFKRCTDQDTLKILVEIKKDFLSSGLAVGNYAVVSTDTRVAIAAGFISKLTKDEISIGLERNLFERYKNKRFHVDTYESQTIFNYSLTNIATLLHNNEKAKRLRELIIDRQSPQYLSKLSRSIAVTGGPIIKRLNKNQQRAVLKVFATQDYLLIKGMPGTGKTATIVALIQLLVELKKTVLITSHTNSAVDNVCLRLLDCGVDVLRLGSESRIHPLLKHCSERAKTCHCKSVDELEQVYNKSQVIAVTCLGANHPLLSKRTLDVCVVDESTQVLQCSVFKALQSTKTFVLIGDPEQLPPVVSNPEAVSRGMNESLFQRLDTSDNTITLTLQYRMNKTITSLANNLTYNGQLLCADDSIGYAILRLPKIERLQTIYHSEPWLISVLDTHVENSVVAIDTGPTWKKIANNGNMDILEDLKVPVQNVQEDEERLFENIYETAITAAIIEALKQGGVQSDAIGVIAPYRSQVAQLKKIISKIDEKYHSSELIEVNTVDQYQGRDKEVIIYSCTKSRDTSKLKIRANNFEILEDKRRLTVAITRAKHKLIIIGDFCTLKAYSPFETLLNSLEPHQVLPLAYESRGFSWEKTMEKLKCYDT